MKEKVQGTVFGDLIYSRSGNEFSGEMRHKEASITVRIACDSVDTIDRILPFATKVWKSRAKHFKTFRDYAVADLLEPLNGLLDCGEASPQQISANKLRRILAAPFSIYFFMDGNDCDTPAFRLAGGDDAVLDRCCLEVFMNEKGKITDGNVVSLC